MYVASTYHLWGETLPYMAIVCQVFKLVDVLEFNRTLYVTTYAKITTLRLCCAILYMD